MRNFEGLRTFVALGIAAALVAAPAAPAHAGLAFVELTGSQEATPNTSTASGTFEVKIKGARLCYTLDVSGLQGPSTGAHVHVAPVGTAGPVVIPLPIDLGVSSFTVENCVEADKLLLQAIRANPGGYYVNVHSSVYPAGEIRGQLG